jgi:5-methylcytosine-specific restriction endonuclease McrA
MAALSTKACTKCKVIKSFSEFRKSQKGDKHGLHSWCHDCNRAARRSHYANNKEKYRDWHREWVKRNPDKVEEYNANKPKYEYSRWISLPGRRSAKKGYEQNYRARKVSAPGVITKAEVERLLEVYGSKCLRCGSNDDICIDHVVPLSKGGSNEFVNLQPLCRGCNSWKRDRDFDFRQGEGRSVD